MFTTFAYTAFRLELQPRYRKPNETNTLRRFLAGPRHRVAVEQHPLTEKCRAATRSCHWGGAARSVARLEREMGGASRRPLTVTQLHTMSSAEHRSSPRSTDGGSSVTEQNRVGQRTDLRQAICDPDRRRDPESMSSRFAPAICAKNFLNYGLDLRLPPGFAQPSLS